MNGPAIIRELKGAPLAVVSLLIYMQRTAPNTPVTAQWLQDWSGYSDKTVAAALRYLEGKEYARRALGGGWLAGTAATQLPLFPPELPACEDVQSVDNPVDNPVENASAIRKFSDPIRRISGSGGRLKSLKSSQSKKPDVKTDLDSDDPGKTPATSSQARILAAAESLFGERPFGDGGDYPDAEHLLAWIAQAWEQRAKFEHPARIVYAHARYPDDKRHRPTAKYRAWWKHLPESFLAQAGLGEIAAQKQETAVYAKYTSGYEDFVEV